MFKPSEDRGACTFLRGRDQNSPDNGSNVGIELGHENAHPNNEDVQKQNVEEAVEGVQRSTD